MLKLSRNKIYSSLTALMVLFGIGKPLMALPISSISIAATPSNVKAYEVGIDTDTLNVIVQDSNHAAPTTTETITLWLEDNSQVIPGAVSPATITTTPNIQVQTGVIRNLKIFRANSTGSLRLRARTASGITDEDLGSILFKANAGAANQLVVLGPGMTLTEGNYSNPSAPALTTGTNPKPGDNFAVTVWLTDQYFNHLKVAGTFVTLTGVGSTISTAAGALDVNGSKEFTCTISSPKTAVSFSATGGGFSGATTVTSAGPSTEEVFLYPSPFKPKSGGLITFKFLTDSSKSYTLKVTDQFGEPVWENSGTSLSGSYTATTWNGKNSEGSVVAAGVYYVLLELNSELKSKKRFGVTK